MRALAEPLGSAVLSVLQEHARLAEGDHSKMTRGKNPLCDRPGAGVWPLTPSPPHNYKNFLGAKARPRQGYRHLRPPHRLRSQLRQARRVQQILVRRRYKAWRLSVGRSALGQETYFVYSLCWLPLTSPCEVSGLFPGAIYREYPMAVRGILPLGQKLGPTL